MDKDEIEVKEGVEIKTGSRRQNIRKDKGNGLPLLKKGPDNYFWINKKVMLNIKGSGLKTGLKVLVCNIRTPVAESASKTN